MLGQSGTYATKVQLESGKMDDLPEPHLSFCTVAIVFF
jgi:hypothetical protein